MATDRTVRVRLTADPKGFIGGMKAAQRAVSDLRRDIDTTNDRTAWLAQSFLALGPALGPLGAVGAGALAGLATQLTFTATAATVTTMAFNGIGDALGALNDYQIDPTEAHLKKLHETMALIGPTGRDLVRVLDEMRNGFIGLSNLSRDNMFPGVIDGLEELKVLGPQVEQIIAKTAGVIGDLASRAGEGLAGERFADFFDFLEADAVPTLDAMGRIIGNVADGLGAMLVAFAPLSRDFTGGMLEMSRAFADWAHGLRDNDSFEDFVAFIRENTPRVLDLFAQMVDTFLAIAEAAAPVGEVMIPLFTTIFELIEALVATPLGPVFIAAAAAMGLYGRAAALASITTGGLAGKVGKLALGFGKLEGAAQRGELAVGKYKASLGRTVGTLGAFAFAMSPIPEKLGLSNTALGAMTGALAGPWGLAVGAGVGLMFDLAKNTEKFQISASDIAQTLDEQTGAVTEATRKWVVYEAAQQGILTSAERLGIDLPTLTDAMLGNEVAIEQVNRAMERQIDLQTDAMRRNRADAASREQLRDDMNAVTGAIDGTNEALVTGRDNMLLTGEALDTTARKFKKVVKEVDYFGEALDRLDAKLDRRANLRDYEAAMDAITRSIKENGTTLDIDFAKGRENQANLDAFADSIKEIAATLEGQARVDFLNDAFRDLERLAGKFGKNREEIRKLKEDLGLLGLKKATPSVRVGGVDIAKSKVDSLERGLRNLSDITATPKIVLGLARDTGANFGSGPGFAEGGYTGPGGKHEVAGLVHRGEFVFDADTTARNRGFFEAIHKGMAGYANGGYVAASAQPAVPMPVGIDYDRLASAMLRARPIHGDVTVIGDQSFEREMRQSVAIARAGGY